MVHGVDPVAEGDREPGAALGRQFGFALAVFSLGAAGFFVPGLFT